MSVRAAAPATPGQAALSPLWTEIAAGAVERDRQARFPVEAFEALGAAGVLGARGRVAEWALVRAAARVDGSVARVLDGHFNAAERLDLLAPPALRMHDLAEVAAGRLWLGVWGADPARPHEGEPARLGTDGRVRGTKLFCSGAGGIHRALVTVRGGSGDEPPLLAYLDVREGDGVEIDRSWFNGAGMRASESHRVTFDGVEPLALLGEPGELVRDPWFSRDAMRTAATWVGLADGIADAALTALAERPHVGELEAHAAGKLIAARGTCDAWIALAARRAEDDARATSIAYRAAIAAAAREIVETAASACGTRPFAAGGLLERHRRDLELFLHQHRLDPLLARLGRARLEQLR